MSRDHEIFADDFGFPRKGIINDLDDQWLLLRVYSGHFLKGKTSLLYIKIQGILQIPGSYDHQS